MSMSDPIADLLTRIRNANQGRHETLTIPASRLKEDICKVLVQEGFIAAVERLEEGPQGTLRITMKYTESNDVIIRGIKRVSKPSLRIYKKRKGINQVLSGLGTSIMSTSKGVMTGRQARREGIGGEVLCEIW